MIKEKNPFEDLQVAKEWIKHIENTKGEERDKVIYPLLKNWIKKIRPKTVVEIGSGQGICSGKTSLKDKSSYVGIEPSKLLVKRAKKMYERSNRKFIVGNAYKIPLKDNSVDAVFSVNVWFHLGNLKKASSELSRILKRNGYFLIITANPRAHKIWESFHFDYKKYKNKIVGKVWVPVNPLSSSIFYKHTLADLKKSLNSNKLSISKIKEIGILKKKEPKLFISIFGQKID